MYYIHDWYNNKYKTFYDWWELIKWFYHNDSDLKTISHNKNDIYSYHNFRYKKVVDKYIDYETVTVNKIKKLLLNESEQYVENNRYVYVRQHIVYDQFENIINKEDIRKSLIIYNPQLDNKKPKQFDKLSFRYRFDPVPCIKIYPYKYRYRHNKINKNYYAKIQETIHLFPQDGRMRKKIKDVSNWYDDYDYRYTSKVWKQKKIKKQWMKHQK